MSEDSNIREIGIELARLIAGLAVDPHGYFEKKYIARIENAHTDIEVNGVLAQLVQWAVSSSISDSEREKLDRELANRGFPDIAELRLQYLP